jgi:hypothetical protein
MAMLYLYFLGNAAFYKSSTERVSSPLWNFGPLKFDVYDVSSIKVK